MEALLRRIAESWRDRNVLEHSKLTLQRYVDIALAEDVPEWSIALPTGERTGDSERLYQRLRSLRSPFLQIGVQTQVRVGTPQRETRNYWGAFVFEAVSLPESVTATICKEPAVFLVEAAEAWAVDVVYFYYIPPTIFEGMAYQRIRQEVDGAEQNDQEQGG